MFVGGHGSNILVPRRVYFCWQSLTLTTVCGQCGNAENKMALTCAVKLGMLPFSSTNVSLTGSIF